MPSVAPAVTSTGIVAFASERLGLELYPKQAEILAEIERSGASEVVLCLGRRSGKDLMTSVLALHHGVCTDLSGYLRPGEPRYVVIVATSQEQARLTLDMIRQLIAQSRGLQSLVTGETADEIALATGVVIRCVPCNARSIRGPAVSMAVMNEAAHFLSTTDGHQTAERVHASLSPALAQFGDEGRLMYLSSPLWPTGLFHRKYTQAVQGAPGMLAFKASTAEMNPRVSRAWLARQQVADPELYAVEYEAEFSQAVTAYLSAAAVDACITGGVYERPPREGVEYVLGVDPGYSGDRFGVVAVGRAGDRLVVDLARQWGGSRANPVDHDAALAEVAEIAHRYNRARAVTDQFCAQPVKQGLTKLGIRVDYAPWTNDSKREAFGCLKAAVNTGGLDLLDVPELKLELISLETRSTPGGRPRIAGRAPIHDDLATALAAAVAALQTTGKVGVWFL